MPDISIITPWLDHTNFAEDYERAVRCPGVEVIVVDNGSADAHAAGLRQMIDRLGGKLIRNEENRWFATANNQGLAAATGDIVVFLNNDIAGDPAWLEGVRRDVRPGGLYGPVLLSLEIDGRPIPYHEGWCVAGTRETWDRLGGWDAGLHSMPYWEDNDLGFRAIAAGLKLVQTDWPVRHKGQGTSIDVPGVRFGFERVRERFYARVRGQSPLPADPAAARDADTFEEADRLHTQGYLPEAERAYRKALDREPANGPKWARYAEVLHLSGRHDAAAQALRRALEFRPDDAGLWTNLGAILGRSRRHEDSAEALRRAVTLAPHFAEAHNNLSRAMLNLGRFPEAEQSARETIRLKPGFVPAHVNLSNALRSQNRLAEALDAAEAAARLNPKSVIAQNALGASLRAQGRPAEALAAFRRALALTPHDIVARNAMEELAGPEADRRG